MPSLGRAPRRPNCLRRRNSNPGAKSSTFIFTETARLQWTGERRVEISSRAMHPTQRCTAHHHHSNSSPPLPASSRQRVSTHTQNCWREDKEAWEETGSRVLIPCLYTQTE